MRKTGILLSLCCALALCLALVGCGGSSGEGGGNDAAKAAFAGSWDLVEITQNGEETSSEDIEMLSSLGLDVYLTLNEDGTSELVLFGESMEGTWTAESETAGTIVIQGASTAMTIEGENLMLEEEDSSLTFKKGEPRDGASAQAASDESSSDEGTDASAEEGDSEEAEE